MQNLVWLKWINVKLYKNIFYLFKGNIHLPTKTWRPKTQTDKKDRASNLENIVKVEEKHFQGETLFTRNGGKESSKLHQEQAF